MMAATSAWSIPSPKAPSLDAVPYRVPPDKSRPPRGYAPSLLREGTWDFYKKELWSASNNDFIAVHLKEIGGGLTYAQLSAKAMALPKGSVAYTAAEAKV